MASLVSVTALPVLVLVCGSLLHQTSAGTDGRLMETVSLLFGHYGGPHYQGHSMGYDDDWFILKPVDIPALNQYFPYYYAHVTSGELAAEGIYLFTRLSDDTYVSNLYSLKGVSKYNTPELDLSTITRDDLTTEPTCREEIVQRDDAAMTLVQCFDDPETEYVITEYTYTCDYIESRWLNHKDLPDDLTLRYWKSELYTLPGSWLEGNKDYVDPCQD